MLRDAAQQLVAVDAPTGTFRAEIKDPFNTQITELNAELWTRLATLLWDDLDVAERCLRTALHHQSDLPRARLLLGWYLVGRGRTKDSTPLPADMQEKIEIDVRAAAAELFAEHGFEEEAQRVRDYR